MKISKPIVIGLLEQDIWFVETAYKIPCISEKLGIFSIAEFDVAKFQEAIYTKLPITRHQKTS